MYIDRDAELNVLLSIVYRCLIVRATHIINKKMLQKKYFAFCSICAKNYKFIAPCFNNMSYSFIEIKS